MRNFNFLLFVLLLSNPLMAQYGVLDPTLDPGAGADNTIQVVAMQADSKILIGGTFLTYDGTNRKRIARIHPDGTLDTDFNIGSGANNIVHEIIVQPDGKIIAAGSFSVFNNTAQKKIVRLNSDGTIDPTFDTGFGANDDILCTHLLPDGKILIGGFFSAFDWTARNGFARLNADGSLDQSFVPNAPLTSVTKLNVLPDGKMLINDTNKVFKLNEDGSIDSSFFSGIGTDLPIQALHLQSNGKILVGGYFTTYNGENFNRLVRLNEDGSVDTTFEHGSGADYGVLTITEQSDGQLLLSGLFSNYKGTPAQKVVRIDPDGNRDFSFTTGLGPDNIVLHHFVQPDGRVIIAGDFLNYNHVSRNRIARISGHLPLSTTDFAMTESIQIYPNPSSQILNINIPDGISISKYSIIDLTGKKLADYDGTITSLNTELLSSGVYILAAHSQNQVFNMRFIKN